MKTKPYRQHVVRVAGQTATDAYNARINGIPMTMDIAGARVGDYVSAFDLRHGNEWVLMVSAVDGDRATLVFPFTEEGN